MLQLTHSKNPTRVGAPPRRRTAVATPRAEAPPAPVHANAAPLMLVAVVVGAELLAVTAAIVGALAA